MLPKSNSKDIYNKKKEINWKSLGLISKESVSEGLWKNLLYPHIRKNKQKKMFEKRRWKQKEGEKWTENKIENFEKRRLKQKEGAKNEQETKLNFL